MLSPQQINYILTLAETSNFSRAAEQCFVTQPTLSMQLKKAEEVLGHALFERTSQKITLTNFGEQILPVLRQIQQDYDAIQQLADEKSGIHKKVLRIGMIPTLSVYLLRSAFGAWSRLLPTTRLEVEELTTKELLRALENRKIDLGILAGPAEMTNIRSIPLYVEEIMAYTGEMNSSEITMGLLAEMQPWLLSKGNCLRTQMLNFCKLADTNDRQWTYSGGNLDLLTRMVDEFGGYTLIPENAKHLFRESPQRITNEHGLHPARSIIAVGRERNPQWASMEKIIRDVQHEFGSAVRNDVEILSWN